MNKNDKTKFSKALLVAAQLFDRELSNIIIGLYFDALKEYSIKQAEDAISKAIKSCKFFPKPAEIIELISDGSVKIEDRALIIANQIISHVHTAGSRVFPKLDDPIAKHLMTTRWPYYEWASNLIESEEKWWTKEFCEMYRAYSRTDLPLAIDAPEKVKKIVNLKSIDDVIKNDTKTNRPQTRAGSPGV